MTIDDCILEFQQYSYDYEQEMCDGDYSSQQREYAQMKWEYYKQLAEWLEELKQIRQWKADVMEDFCKCDCNSIDEVKHNARNKAIDDFAREIKPYIAEYRSAIKHNRYAFIDVNNIAEQLKVGGNNE